MQWDYNSLANKDVIIGYHDSKSNFVNAQLDLASSADANKFRPDKMTGNTGLKGQWLYRLDDNGNRVYNPKRVCLSWYRSQPSPKVWNRGLGTCPCAFGQGNKDQKYGNRRRQASVDRSRNSQQSSPVSDDVIKEIESNGKIFFFPN